MGGEDHGSHGGGEDHGSHGGHLAGIGGEMMEVQELTSDGSMLDLHDIELAGRLGFHCPKA